EAKEAVKTARNQAWTAYRGSIRENQETVNGLLKASLAEANRKEEIKEVVKQLSSVQFPIRRDIVQAASKAVRILRDENIPAREELIKWLEGAREVNKQRYNTYLYATGKQSPLNV